MPRGDKDKYWARYAEGVDEQGEPIDVQDQLADTLVPLAR